MSDETQAPVVAPPHHSPMTFEQFLDWADEDTHAEWVAGEVIAMSPASVPHQRLSQFLASTLGSYVEAAELGTVLAAPVLMRLPVVAAAREPDLAYVSRANSERLTDAYIDGPADLVVEIVSAGSRTRDRRDKLIEYEASGVREYWVIDPLRQRAEFHNLAADGCYDSRSFGAQGRFESAVLPGLWLDVSWLWQSPLPRVREVERAWGLLS